MKILVVHASAGAGHQKAAEAVVNGIKKYTAHEVTLLDALDLTSSSFKKLYRGTYLFLTFWFVWRAERVRSKPFF